MRQPVMLLAISTLGACASPLPPVDTKQAWIDLYTVTPGKVLMADRLGLDYGLRLPGGEIAPDTGAAHRRRCLEALALC